MYVKELELEGLELVDPNADYSGTQTIFIDFDGANGVSYDNDALNIYINNIDVEDSGINEEEQFQIITNLNNSFAGTGVSFTVTAPINEEYSTIYVGGDGSAFSECGNFLGLSETIDAGNQIKNDEAFVFSDNINSLSAVTKIITHETGHLLGFAHNGDTMTDKLSDFAVITTLPNGSTRIIASENSNDGFGGAVAIDGTTVIIGAEHDGDGSAYVYRWNNNSYVEYKLTGVASDDQKMDLFGHSVDIDGDNIIVGVSSDDHSGNGHDAGSAYIYSWNGTAYDEFRFVASDGVANDFFGTSVAISGDTAVIGTPSHYNDYNSLGSVYIYQQQDDDSYSEIKLTSSDGTEWDMFGYSVAIDNGTVVVGAYGDDDNGSDSGSAYVYRWNGSSYDEHKLIASDHNAYANFGYSVAIDGDTIVVGAIYDYDYGLNYGSAYVYRWNGSSYDEHKLIASDHKEGYSNFGYSVAIDGDTIVVGTDHMGGDYSGGTYVYTWDGTSYSEYKLIVSENNAFSSGLGSDVAVSGNTVVAGGYSNFSDGNDVYLFDLNGVINTDLEVSANSYDFGIATTSWSFEISNAGDETLQYSISVEDNSFADVFWLHISDSEGSATGDNEDTITVTVNRNMLGLGINTATIIVENSMNSIDKETITINATRSIDYDFDTTAPTVPAEFSVIIDDNSAIADWTDSTDVSGVREYVVEYVMTDGQEFTNSSLQTLTVSEWDISDLSDGLYYWRVKAVDNTGNESAWSANEHFTIDSFNHVYNDVDQLITLQNVSSYMEFTSNDSQLITSELVYNSETSSYDGSLYIYDHDDLSAPVQSITVNATRLDVYNECLVVSDRNNLSGESSSGDIYIYNNVDGMWGLTQTITEGFYNGGGQIEVYDDLIAVTSKNIDYFNPESSINTVEFYYQNDDTWQHMESVDLLSSGPYAPRDICINEDWVFLGTGINWDGDLPLMETYVYKQNGSELISYDVLERPEEFDCFGYSIAADGDFVAVSAAKKVTTDYGMTTENNSVLMYKLENDAWNLFQTIDAPMVRHNEGMILDGNTLIVTNHGNDPFARIGDDGEYYPVEHYGEAYVYKYNGASWGYSETLVPSEGPRYGDEQYIAIGGENAYYHSANQVISVYEIETTLDETGPTVPTGLLQTASEGSVALGWADSSDADSGIKQYNIQVDNNSDFSSLEYSGSVVDSTLSLTDLENGAYFWRVQAEDNADNTSAWSNGTSFLFNDGTGGESTYELFYGHFSGGSTDEIIKFDTDSHELEISRDGEFVALAETGSGWSVAATGDLNGDGCDDILLANEEFNALGAWTMNEDGSYGWMNIGSLPMPEWQVKSVVDLDGNGVDDMLLYWEEFNYYGAWLLDNGGNISWRGFGQIADGWEIGGTGDFNGDNREDLYLVNAEYGAVGTWLMNEDANGISWQTIGAYNPNIWSIEGAGDFDGNGVDDLLLKWDDLNYLGAWKLDGLGNIDGWASFGQYEASWDLSGIADVNGDGTDDILMGAAGSDYIGARLVDDGAVSGWMTIAS